MTRPFTSLAHDLAAMAEATRATAALGRFPYPHRTVAEVDAAAPLCPMCLEHPWGSDCGSVLCPGRAICRRGVEAVA